MHFVFEVTAFNELDHFTPIADGLLKEGHHVRFVLGSDTRLATDARSVYLRQFPGFAEDHLQDLQSAWIRWAYNNLLRALFGRPLRKWQNSPRKLSALVGLASATGMFRRFNSFEIDCGVSGWGDPSSFVMTATSARQKPIVALPHGYPCLKNQNFNAETDRILQSTGKPPDFSLRNEFSVYVVATERNREMLRSWRVDEDRLQVWGNARFSPSWVKQLREILPPSSSVNKPSGRGEILFLLPSSSSRFRRQELITLLDTLATQQVHLVLKPHTRDINYQSIFSTSLLQRDNVTVGSTCDTTKLIERADTVINFATGTAIETLFAKKRLIFARYLSDNSFSWEDCRGIRIADSLEDCVAFAMDGTWTLDDNACAPYIAQEVFAGGRISDPVSHYVRRLTEIASAKR